MLAILVDFGKIWCSDNTDALARLTIQTGTSYGYPASAVGAHVSASPNHQTGRTAPLGTRAVVAMSHMRSSARIWFVLDFIVKL